MKEKPFYFRRCHVCGGVTACEGKHHVEHCEHCGKPLARFQYYDDRFTPTQSDRNLRPSYLPGEFTPIQGLTVYWEASPKEKR